MRDQLEHHYRIHRQGLFSLAMSITGCQQMAEDAIHSAFARLCRSELNNVDDLTSYVFASVRNAARDAVRADQRTKSVHESIFEQHTATATSERPEDGLLNDERNELLRQMIESLPSGEREVIVLKIYSGLTFETIGRIIDLPTKTVASRYRRSLMKLEEKLREQS